MTIDKEKFKRGENVKTTFLASPFNNQKRPFVRSPKENMGAGNMLEKAVQKEISSSVFEEELRIRINYYDPGLSGKVHQTARETWATS